MQSKKFLIVIVAVGIASIAAVAVLAEQIRTRPLMANPYRDIGGLCLSGEIAKELAQHLSEERDFFETYSPERR